jgi:hypothetical protein
MSVRQYLRKASLIIGRNDGSNNNALDLSTLRFTFAIKRGDLQTPNTADVRIYNVAPNTMLAIEKEYTRLVIQAGYDGNFGVIFDGLIKQVRRGRESATDTYIDITVADGDAAYNYSMSAFALAAGSKPNDRVSAILEAMATNGVVGGYVPDLGGNPLPRGKSVFAMSRDELRNIAFNAQSSWSIQDGKLNMIPITAYQPGQIPVITAATGMIGLPEQTQNGIRVKCLLNPNIKIGQAIKLDNESIQRYRFGLGVTDQPTNFALEQQININNDGLYYVMMAEHSGDTRGQEWITDLICLAIDATITPLFAPTFPIGQDYVNSIKRFG